MNRYLAATLLFGSLYTAPSAHAASVESFLIRYHSLVADTARGLKQDVEVLIFNDGLVIEKSVTNDSSTFMLRAQASPKDLADLRRTLAANQVGAQAGNCRAVNPLPVDSYDLSVTWFGKGGRSHSFAAGQGFSAPCPAPTASILEAINAFIEKARQSPGVETVEFHS
jgi:hypothetical protein